MNIYCFVPKRTASDKRILRNDFVFFAATNRSDIQEHLVLFRTIPGLDGDSLHRFDFCFSRRLIHYNQHYGQRSGRSTLPFVHKDLKNGSINLFDFANVPLSPKHSARLLTAVAFAWTWAQTRWRGSFWRTMSAEVLNKRWLISVSH